MRGNDIHKSAFLSSMLTDGLLAHECTSTVSLVSGPVKNLWAKRLCSEKGFDILRKQRVVSCLVFLPHLLLLQVSVLRLRLQCSEL